jgi:hypothetical protein
VRTFLFEINLYGPKIDFEVLIYILEIKIFKQSWMEKQQKPKF